MSGSQWLFARHRFLIDLNRDRRNILRQRAEKLLLSINDADLYISSVVVTEFLTGVPEDKQESVQKMLKEQYFYLAPAYEDAVLAGKLHREWLAHGYTLALSDVTNAALALSRKLVLVTRNAAHYPFPELKIIGW